MITTPMIEVKNLKKYFVNRGPLGKSRYYIRAVDDVNLSIARGKIVGLVGESGCGKTTLASAILNLTKTTSGSIMIDGVDVVHASRSQMNKLRRNIAVVFQDPASNLNPRFSVETSIMRPMRVHGISRKEARKRAEEVLDMVKMDRMYLQSYPHQLSGGQLQRIAVARALVLRPKVMILDEPTSALDVSVQAQVLNLLLSLQEELMLTYLVITHDLNVVRYISDEVAVMYLGRLVEYGPAWRIFDNPQHPYTKGLMSAAPIIDPTLRSDKPLLIKGEPGSLISISIGCRLAPRCPYKIERCITEDPALIDCGEGHFVGCHLVELRVLILSDIQALSG